MPRLKTYKVLFTTEADVDTNKKWFDVLDRDGCSAFKTDLFDEVEEADLIIFTKFNTHYILKRRY